MNKIEQIKLIEDKYPYIHIIYQIEELDINSLVKQKLNYKLIYQAFMQQMVVLMKKKNIQNTFIETRLRISLFI